MNKALLLIPTVLALSSSAFADADPEGIGAGFDDVWYKSRYAGVDLGVGSVTALGLNLDVGVRIAKRPLYLHTLLGVGAVPMTEGRSFQARTGLEVRDTTPGGFVHWFAGVDAGFAASSAYYDPSVSDFPEEMTEHHPATKSLIGGPRVGFELGEQTRLRITIESPASLDLSTAQITPGLAVSLGIVTGS